MKYTAEEVRARVNKAWQNHDEQGRVFITMGDAMALVETILPERIKADESVVPAAWQYRYKNDRLTWSKWLAWAPEEHPEAPFPKTIGRWEVEYRKLFIHPPAQAAQVDDSAVASFVERAASVICGKSFPTGSALAKAREISDLALSMLTTPEPVAQGEAIHGRCKACGRATRAVCDGLDGNGLGCTNAPPIDIAATQEGEG